jgi:hypothetical protein
MSNVIFKLALRRLLIVSIAALGLTLFANETFFRLQKESHDRPPQEVELVIPAGTAAQIASGGSVPSIPEEMIFVVGDVLMVRNEDGESHQLGPLWVPAYSTARLNLDQPMQYVYNCSFQSSSYMGLEVRPPVTLGTRLQGLFLAGPPTIIFVFLYSLVLFPLQPAQQKVRTPGAGGAYTRQSSTAASSKEEV